MNNINVALHKPFTYAAYVDLDAVPVSCWNPLTTRNRIPLKASPDHEVEIGRWISGE